MASKQDIFILYGTKTCSYCDKARKELFDFGIIPVYIDLATDLDALDFIKNKEGYKTVPQVYVLPSPHSEEAGDPRRFSNGYTDLQGKLIEWENTWKAKEETIS